MNSHSPTSWTSSFGTASFQAKVQSSSIRVSTQDGTYKPATLIEPQALSFWHGQPDVDEQRQWEMYYDFATEPDAARLTLGPIRTAMDPIHDDDLSRRAWVLDMIESSSSSGYEALETNMPANIGLGALDIIPGLVNGTALTTIAGTANRIEVVPFIPARDIVVTTVGVDVTTVVAGSNVKVLVYGAHPTTGAPDGLITSVPIATTTAGTRTANVTIPFDQGKLYWIGVAHSSTATIRGIPIAAMPSIGVPTGGAVNATLVRASSGTYTTPPNPLSARTYVSAIAPLVRLRI